MDIANINTSNLADQEVEAAFSGESVTDEEEAHSACSKWVTFSLTVVNSPPTLLLWNILKTKLTYEIQNLCIFSKLGCFLYLYVQLDAET